MTQLEAAREGIITPEMIRVAVRENTTPELIREHVATGRIIIPANKRHLAGSGGQEAQGTEARRHAGTEGRRDGGKKGRGQGDDSFARHSEFDIRYSAQAAGHPGFTPDGALWVNQTVAQR